MVPRFFLKEKQLGLASEMLGCEGAKLTCTMSQAGARGGGGAVRAHLGAEGEHVSARRGPGASPLSPTEEGSKD